MPTTTLTAPAGYNGDQVETNLGTVYVIDQITNTVVVDSQEVTELLAVGFTAANLPNPNALSNPTVLAAPAGVTEVESDAQRFPVVAGHVTVPAYLVPALLNAGYTL